MTRWSPITESGGPSAITLPCAITMTQSEMSRTMSMSCSTNSTVRPSSRSDFTWPSRDCFNAGLTPAIGSSSLTSSGSAISARAISSSLRWPPESDPAKSSRFLISRNRSSSASARSVFDCSWPRQNGANIARRRLSPRCPVAPTRMFSRTVSLERTLVSWKVRTMPMRDTRYAGTPLRLVPLKDQSPWSGRSNPVSRLKNVVLPAPFGPMSPVITPRWISTWSTSTAVRPPKVRRTWWATTTGSGFLAPGSCGTSRRAARAADTSTVDELSAGIECQLPSVPENALRPVDHQQHQRQPHHHEPHQARLVAVHDRGGDRGVRARRGLTEEQVEEAQQEPEDHGARDRAENPCSAADQKHRVGEEGGVGREERRVDRGVLEGGHDARQTADDAADDQRLHLVGVDVLAEAADGVLVLADALEHAAPGAAHQCPHDQAAEGGEEPADEQRPEVVGTPGHHAGDADAGGEGVEGGEAAVEALQAVLAAEELQQRDRADGLPDDLGRGDRDDRQVVRAQPQGGHPEEQGQHGRRAETDEAAQPKRQAPRGDERGDGVAAHGHEARLAEVEQSGVPEVHVEADRGQAVDRGDRSQTLLQALAEDGVPVHVLCLLTDPLGLAEQALGPDQQNDDEYDECADELELGG